MDILKINIKGVESKMRLLNGGSEAIKETAHKVSA
jgi:hypothetical protein